MKACMPHSLFDSLQRFPAGAGKSSLHYSLPRLEEAGIGPVSRLPVSLRIILESLLRNYDGKRIKEEDIRHLACWSARAQRREEVPFVVARVILQDFTGVPLLVDLAAMRSASSTIPCRSISGPAPTRSGRTWRWNSRGTENATGS